jgi:[ribosomal protein S18]-alanine N-acetyltransferase
VRAREPSASAPPAFPTVAVRRMVMDDLEAVMALERAAFRHPWSTELFRRELMHDWSTILIAEPAPTQPPQTNLPGVLGFVIFWLVHDEVHILNLATHPRVRRSGIGRLLMTEVLEHGRRNGAALATLEVRRSNLPALALYRGLAFRAIGVRPNYYVDEGEDAVVMTLDI